MIITVECPHCHSTFPVDPAKVPAGGVKVRCSNCSGIFRVEKPEEEAPSPPPPAEPEVAPEPMVSHEPEADAAPQVSHEPEADAAPQVSHEPEAHHDPEPQVVADEEAPREPEPDWMEEPRVEAEDPAPDFGGPHVDEPTAGAGEWTDDEVEDEGGPVAEPGSAVDDAGAAEMDVEMGWGSDFGTAAIEEAEEEDLPAEVAPEPDQWVFETEDDLDPSSLEVERLDTVEEQMRSASEESYETEDGMGQAMGGTEAPAAPFDGAPEPEPTAESAPEEPAQDHAEAAEPAPPEATTPPSGGFQFGRRDPKDKAKRLARVLVSDIITYNPERHARALENGTLPQDFEDEIQKSWAEYVEQVGRDIAESTSFFTEALNDILARGEQVFDD